jgi:hypothetical protein
MRFGEVIQALMAGGGNAAGVAWNFPTVLGTVEHFSV